LSPGGAAECSHGWSVGGEADRHGTRGQDRITLRSPGGAKESRPYDDSHMGDGSIAPAGAGRWGTTETTGSAQSA